MAMIDILKLNAELDEMIARQDAETEEIKKKTLVAKEDKFNSFITSMRDYASVAEKVSNGVRVFVGSYNDGYGNMRCYDVTFTKANHRLTISHMTTLGDDYKDFSIGYYVKYRDVCSFGGARLFDEIAAWFERNESEFERRFEEACVKAIKRKAESANERYANAEKKYKEVCGAK